MTGQTNYDKKMKRSACMILCPVCFLTILMLMVVCLAVILISAWSKVNSLILRHDEYSSLIHKNIRKTFILLGVMIGAMAITICIFLHLIVPAARKEMHLRRSLINQMEATQQSERKSMNKTLAFASASHDIRAALAGITGLIEISRVEVSKRDPSGSAFQDNLQQMETCTKDLLRILNSILDTSKIEAGKMQLEEEEFDIAQLLEDVVDLYHPVGMKKGVDVILDPCDGSVMKFSRVKGDRGRLKQILCNLLSNAVKFTAEGHVTVRAWARKQNHENAILGSDRNTSVACLTCMLSKNGKPYSESEAVTQCDPNSMEFVFEVNDTGKGIPKEKRNSVFENYVQVKENALGHEGTGLGLGIVQSLVRLMGGEIKIMDKEVGDRGTCFRVNVILNTCDTDMSSCNDTRTSDIEANFNYISSNSFRYSGTLIRTHTPKSQGSRVILFGQSLERSRIIRNFMNRFGIKVDVVEKHEQLCLALKRFKRKRSLSCYSSSGSDGHRSCPSGSQSTDVALSAQDGTDNFLAFEKKPNARSNSVLIVIDTQMGPFREVSRALAEFRRGLSQNCCSRVVWLDSPSLSSSNLPGLDEDKLPPSDLFMSKPFHGSRLYQAIELLPEFRPAPPPRNVEEATHQSTPCLEAIISRNSHLGKLKGIVGQDGEMALTGKKILVVDDDPTGRKIAAYVASQLGADVHVCENGKEAWNLVRMELNEDAKVSPPFDCILMDCQMPVMDGIEATRRIREAEKSYGLHIPIIALTAHDKGELEIHKMTEAGVDTYLTKPLNKPDFVRAVLYMNI